MSKIFYLFLVMFLLSSFAYREPNYCKMVDCITNSYVKEFAKSRCLMISGSGGAMMDDIQNISLRFFSRAPMNVDEARILYVEMMEEFLRRINCDEKIRPYLHNFPFKEDNIKLTISFINSEGRKIRDGHVALMGIARDHMLYFAAYDPCDEDFYDLCEEPYAEARKTVIGH